LLSQEWATEGWLIFYSLPGFAQSRIDASALGAAKMVYNTVFLSPIGETLYPIG
jgi:hypothetical protein